MARRSNANSSTVSARPAIRAPRNFLRTVRTVATWTFAAFLIVGALWGMSSLEQFVITDKRFVLEGPPEPGVPDENFQIEGAVHASEQQITRVFLRDFGRSVYLCPVAERRRRLLAIDWVQDATVSRFWPNKLAVRIRERVPVAFVQRMAQDGSTVYGLVDAEGVMLDPQRASKLSLPVLSGMPWKEHESARRDRVKRFLRLQADMGKALDQVSEIDVSDVDNLKVMQVADGRAVTLMLGNQHFLQRFQNYLDNRIEISKRMPNATVLDLRLRDRITAVDSTSENASDSKGSRK